MLLLIIGWAIATGEGQTTWVLHFRPSYIIADAGGDKMDNSYLNPVSWSLENMLIYSCFIFFFLIACMHKFPPFLKTSALSYPRTFVDTFSTQNALPSNSIVLFREASLCPTSDGSVLCCLSGHLFTYSPTLWILQGPVHHHIPKGWHKVSVQFKRLASCLTKPAFL